MSVKTANSFGTLKISDSAIALVAAEAACECYGVISLATQKISDGLREVFKTKKFSKGIKVITIDNRIIIDVYVVLKYGVSLSAVCESLKKSIKYQVEYFTGMIVDSVNVNVIGVRV